MKDYTFHHLATRERGVPTPTLSGAVGQAVAIFNHAVLGDRLVALSRSDIRFMVLTGTWDKVYMPRVTNETWGVQCHVNTTFQLH